MAEYHWFPGNRDSYFLIYQRKKRRGKFCNRIGRHPLSGWSNALHATLSLSVISVFHRKNPAETHRSGYFYSCRIRSVAHTSAVSGKYQQNFCMYGSSSDAGTSTVKRDMWNKKTTQSIRFKFPNTSVKTAEVIQFPLFYGESHLRSFNFCNSKPGKSGKIYFQLWQAQRERGIHLKNPPGDKRFIKDRGNSFFCAALSIINRRIKIYWNHALMVCCRKINALYSCKKRFPDKIRHLPGNTISFSKDSVPYTGR